MSSLNLRHLRNFWMLSVATIVLAAFSDAVAQTGYTVIDQGTLHDGYFGCTMGVNNHGWAETQYGLLVSGKLVKGRLAINVGGSTLDLSTLGGPNSWDNPFGGEINDQGELVGYSETSVPDPDGEDVCGFGTGLICRPFLWRNGHMDALPTLGGNNGQASAMNNHEQITGFAEDGSVDPTCPPNTRNNRVQLPALWENGKARPLPTLVGDTDGEANAINDLGQAVGNSGTCGGATNHAVSWENDVATQLFDYGTFALAFGVNNHGQIVGMVGSPDAPTFYAALWQNGAITNLHTLPGDFAAIASGINNRGQIVGSTLDSSFNWSHAFIWQNGVMTSLDTLFPASANLLPTMANQINDRGQIVGMGTVLSGPHKGETHAFLATPVNASIGKTIADVVQGGPKSNVSTNGNQVLERLRLGRSGQ